VFLGVSTVVANQISVDLPLLLLILLGAVLAHVSVNTLNEYYDFKSGLDLTTTKTRFSGGSGALPENAEMANAVLKIGIVSNVYCFINWFFCLENRIRNYPHRGCEYVIDSYLHWMD